MSSPSSAGSVRNGLAPITPLGQRPLIVPPRPLTPLVGREDAIAAAVAALLRPDTRLLTLTGPGGIGKTRLALAVADHLRDHFEGGVAWAPLAAIRDPALVLPVIAQSLGIVGARHASLADQFPIVLHERRLLLVADNLEQVVAATPDIAGLLLACPTLTVLATSREPLRVSGERIFPVPPLALPDPDGTPDPESLARTEAVRLFAERAAAAAPGFRLDASTAPVIARMCQRLDGLPLAIELAAARVSHLPLETLLDRLEPRLALLTGGPRDAPDRHRTMWNAIAWSYDLLPAGEQALFRRLGAFPGGCTLEAAEAVAGSGLDSGAAPWPPTSILDGIASLVDKNLLMLGTGPDGAPRYRMLVTIREFAAHALEAAAEADDAWRAHARWLLDLTGRHPLEPFLPDDQAWLDRIEAERANLRAVLEWLERRGETGDGARLASDVAWFWFVRSQFHEGRTLLERALASAEPPGPAPSKLIVVLGVIAIMEGRFEDTAPHVREALAAARESGDIPSAARLLIVLGIDATVRGAYDEAIATLGEALAQSLTLEDRLPRLALASAARSNLGVAYLEQGRLAEASAALEAAVAGHRATGSVRGELLTLGDLGDVASDSGNLTLARDHYRAAVTLAWDIGEQRAIVEGIEAVACLCVASDQPTVAARLLAAADRLRTRRGLLARAPRGRAAWRHAVATTRAELGEERFSAAWDDGRALAVDDAVTEALATLAAPAPAAPQPPVGATLTARERDVMRLLVSGATDRAIGDALFIGTRTVESHVSRIFAKLGVRTRSAAVTVALTTGLVEPPPEASEAGSPH